MAPFPTAAPPEIEEININILERKVRNLRVLNIYKEILDLRSLHLERRDFIARKFSRHIRVHAMNLWLGLFKF
jgi:hypothetical protein